MLCACIISEFTVVHNAWGNWHWWCVYKLGEMNICGFQERGFSCLGGDSEIWFLPGPKF